MNFSLISQWNHNEKRTALATLCASIGFSLLFHGFLFMNEMFSHDSLNIEMVFSRELLSYYAERGRFAIPLYDIIKGGVCVPWVVGVLYIFWMCLTSLLLVRLFRVRTISGAVLISALQCANLSLTLTGASYIYCMDTYAFALFTAVLAAYLFDRGGKQALLGLIPLVVSLSIYQSYFTVAVALCFLSVFQRLLEKEPVPTVIRWGLIQIALLAAAFVLYYIIWHIFCIAFQVTMARLEESVLGQGLGMLFQMVWDANRDYFHDLFFSNYILSTLMVVVHAAVLLLLAWRLIGLLRDPTCSIGGKVLMVVMVLLLPTVFQLDRILFPSGSTRLTGYGFELLYVLLVVFREPRFHLPWGTVLRSAAALSLCLVLWQHFVFANQAYLKKDLEKSATIALASRVIDRIERTEGYIPGETSVTFVGMLCDNSYLNHGSALFPELQNSTGLWKNYAATYSLSHYLTQYLNYPLLLTDSDRFEDMPEVQAMPNFPNEGAIQMIDNVVVVKLADPSNGFPS